jgi:hypothetical protein
MIWNDNGARDDEDGKNMGTNLTKEMQDHEAGTIIWHRLPFPARDIAHAFAPMHVNLEGAGWVAMFGVVCNYRIFGADLNEFRQRNFDAALCTRCPECVDALAGCEEVGSR